MDDESVECEVHLPGAEIARFFDHLLYYAPAIFIYAYRESSEYHGDNSFPRFPY